MNNSWTAGQYGLYRAALGAYLSVHLASLIPYAGEVFSERGVLPSAALSPLAAWLPNVLAAADAPSAVIAWLAAGVAAALAFAAGWKDRWAAALLWYIWACLLGRNPLIANPSIPYVGWLLLAHLFVPPTPYGSLDARGRESGLGAWRLPQPIFAAAWAVMAVSYSYSGWTKLQSPSWWDGTAFAYVLSNPLTRDHGMAALLAGLPDWTLKALTWSALGAELLFAPLACSARLRPLLWAALFAMHASLIGLVDFADLSLGMVMFHLFTFDPAWIKGASGGRLFYDDGCAQCQAFVRFVLAEDRREAIRLSPLGGASFLAAGPPRDLPDSVAVLTDDGRWLVRSRAMLHAMAALGGAWRLLAAAASLAPVSLADLVYDFAAARRKKVTGACPVPSAAVRRRLAE